MKRTIGKYAGKDAELTVSDNKTARITFEVAEDDAVKIVAAAIVSGGELELMLEYDGRRIRGNAIEARVDTFDQHCHKLSGPNVVSLSNLKL